MKPLIGITTYYVRDREIIGNRLRGLPGQDMMMSTMDYSRCIEEAGGIPVAIPVIESESYMNDLIARLEGILFTGGSDIDPTRYNSPFQRGLGMIVPERDNFELKLLDNALKQNKPILGICRGFQLLNVYCGGTLYQDIGHANITEVEHVGLMAPKEHPTHKVWLQKGSRVYNAYQQEEVFVNSFHHQTIEKLGENLIATGKSPDGLIEALEHKNYDFVVGVQWHPEMMSDVYPEQLTLFKALIDFAHK
jgi:Predicted glutamine amidotransferases